MIQTIHPFSNILNKMTLEEMIWFEVILDEAVQIGVKVGIQLAVVFFGLSVLILAWMGTEVLRK